MNTRKLAKVAYYISILGWFPFMFLAAWTHNTEQVEIVLLVVGIGLAACMFGAFMLTGLFNNNELFKSIDELNEEKRLYHQARKRLEEKILQL